MSRVLKWYLVAAICLVTMSILILAFTTYQKPSQEIRFRNDIPHYERIFASNDDPIHIAHEIQAAPLMEIGVAKDFRADFISTSIISVDRDQVQEEILGWNCLLHGDYEVFFDYKWKLSEAAFGYTLFSIAAGLDEEGSFANTLHLLKQLHKNGRLVAGDPFNAPVAIQFDHQAAQRVMAGQKIEIVVPMEGTLSFPIGLLNTDTKELPKTSSDVLLAAGFRLMDGKAEDTIYPAAEKYLYAQVASFDPNAAIQFVTLVSSFRRNVLGERLFSTANGLEHILVNLLFLIVLVIWTGMLYFRISDQRLQKRLFAISLLLAFWMLVRVVKLLLMPGTPDRMFWYLYYVPITFLPTILLSIGQIIGRESDKPFTKRLVVCSFIVASLLLALVLTNDYHQVVFRFYRGMEGNNYDFYYSYGWVYYLIFARSLYLIAAFVVLVTRNRVEMSIEGIIPLGLLLTLAAIYFGGYAWGIPVLRESDFSIVYATLSLLFLEISFHNRLIPSYRRMGDLLRSAPIDMHIMTDRMKVQYKTAQTATLPEEIVDRIRELPPNVEMPIGLSQPSNENTLYAVYKINGGYTVFAQHRDSVIRLRQRLAEQYDKIEMQNKVLARTHKVKSEIARLKAQQELFTKIDGVLKNRVRTIEDIYQALSEEKPFENRIRTQKELAKIKMLVNYCKRRGNLALLEAGQESTETTALALWFREAFVEGRAIGLVGVVTETGKAPLCSGLASLLYDCFESVIEKAMACEGAIMLVNLSVLDASLEMRCAIETTPKTMPEDFLPDKDLREALHAAGVFCRAYPHDENTMIQITVQREGV